MPLQAQHLPPGPGGDLVRRDRSNGSRAAGRDVSMLIRYPTPRPAVDGRNENTASRKIPIPVQESIDCWCAFEVRLKHAMDLEYSQ